MADLSKDGVIMRVLAALKEIHSLTIEKPFKGGLGHIGILHGLNMTLSNRIITVLRADNILIHDGHAKGLSYSWNKCKCGPNSTLAIRIVQGLQDSSTVASLNNRPQGGTKACSKCRKIKPYTEFGKASKAKSGIRSQCKECDRSEQTERRAISTDENSIGGIPGQYLHAFSDELLVGELRKRGYEVKAVKTIEL